MRLRTSLTLFLALSLFWSNSTNAQLFTPDKHDNPAEKNFAMHIALGYTSNRMFQFYHFQSGLTYSNKLFGLHLKYDLSAADIFRKKVEKNGNFKAIPNFNKIFELGGGINLYSREGSATCFTQLYSGEEDGFFKEIWGVGNGDAVVYGQIRGGIGLRSFTNETDAIESEPQYYAAGDNWNLGQHDKAYLYTRTPYAFLGWSKVKKFKKDCGTERVGLHKLYFDFLFGKPTIKSIYDDSGNEEYTGYYPIMAFATTGWRIGYEAVRMNPFSGYMSLEAGYYPGVRNTAEDDGLLFVTMRFGFASGPFRAED